MKYRVDTAYFCRIPDVAHLDQHLVAVAVERSDKPVALFIAAEVHGPPNGTDVVSIGLVAPNGKSAHKGPEKFSFDARGRAAIVFSFTSIPVSALGVVSAHILFGGEKQAAPICALQVVPAIGQTDKSKIH